MTFMFRQIAKLEKLVAEEEKKVAEEKRAAERIKVAEENKVARERVSGDWSLEWRFSDY